MTPTFELRPIENAEDVLEFESTKEYVVGVLGSDYHYYAKYGKNKYYKLQEEELRFLKMANTSGFPF